METRMASTSMSSYLPNMSSMSIGTGDNLEQTAMLLDHFMATDRDYVDVSDLLQVPTHKQPSVSGLMDSEYPVMSDPRIGLSGLEELSSVKRVPLPEELVELFGQMQVNCMMGLFPEISRAWLSIDSDIFAWNYEDGGDLAYFDGLSETILSAGLVLPKQGIFQPHIQYLLCLATPTDLILLGVSFTRPNEVLITDPRQGEMHLLPEPLFSIPTDNTHILSITGTSQGRIFMAGKDGCLYELIYQAEDGWFSRKCRKVNHSTSALSFMVPSFMNFSFVEDDPMVQISIDESRNILYTRSQKGSIQVYDLGEDGKGTKKVAAVSLQTTVQNASLIARTIDRAHFRPIVHIAAIPKSESNNIHLVAITKTGVRLYFTTYPFNTPRSRPYMLTLVHVRLPPGFSASARVQSPSQVHAAHYRKGTLLLAASQSEDNDLLWTINPDSFPFKKQLIETHATMTIDSRTWALAEIGCPRPEPSMNGGPTLPKPDPPVVVTQHMGPPRRFVLLSSQGSYLFCKLNPVDQLRELLIQNSGPDAEPVQAFFSLHQREQACATCLILACSSMAMSELQVCEWATRAFFMYGGEPGQITSQLAPTHGGSFLASPGMGLSSPGFNPSQMSTPYPGAQQQPPFQMQHLPQETFYSGKHNGLYLYLARILRPLWDNKLVTDLLVKTAQGEVNYMMSTFTREELGSVAELLSALKQFIDTNSQFVSPLTSESLQASMYSAPQRLGGGRLDMTHMDDQQRKRQRAEAESQEKRSLQQLRRLVSTSLECLGLWTILCEHQFHVVAAALSKDYQHLLRTVTFRNFVSGGKDLAGALIQCLINRYLGDNATTDAISERLREIAPSFYTPEDAKCSKASETLQSAKGSQNKFDRRQKLQDSLDLYKEIAVDLDLPYVCNQFAAVRFYQGIVELSLTAASRRDPQGLALHYYLNGEPPDDLQGKQAFITRMECYRCILETLGHLLSISTAHPHAPSVPKSPGPPPAPDPNLLTNSEAQQHSEEMLQMALKSRDEMFHFALYEWLVARDLTEKLLDIQSPYLETYLRRSAEISPNQRSTLDLLWRYYEKVKNFSAAARILAKLAEKSGNEVNLQERIEYLSRAIMSAKSYASHGSSAKEGEFLHDLEEKMEVARVQLQIYDALSHYDTNLPSVRDAISRLDTNLLDISTLYEDFAEEFDLPECKLAIIFCAGHYDAALVVNLWKNIIDKELVSSIHAPVQSRVNLLRNKLLALGKHYTTTERYFPVDSLVRYLEKKSCDLHLDQTFVFRTLLDIGISMQKLQEIYDRLFKSKDPEWQTGRRPVHLLKTISLLLDCYCQNQAQVPLYARRQFTTVCLDSVSFYLVELQAMSSTDPLIKQLNSNFKELQAKLERL